MPKFKDYEYFTPNVTPKQMFNLGVFGGTYFWPIYSSVVNKHLKNRHLKYKIKVPNYKISNSVYNEQINYYKRKCGSSLEDWESKNWIKKYDPYGWFEWYINFYNGRRILDYDEWQIKRWQGVMNWFGKLKYKTDKIK